MRDVLQGPGVIEARRDEVQRLDSPGTDTSAVSDMDIILDGVARS